MSGRITERGAKAREVIIRAFAGKESLSVRHIFEKTSSRLKLSENAIRKHIDALVADHTLTLTKENSRNLYSLRPAEARNFVYHPQEQHQLNEDQAWRQDISPLIREDLKGPRDIMEICFAEIFNNALSHSGAKEIKVHFEVDALFTVLIIHDNGIGIFKKIRADFNLPDEHQALLELSKGKMTSDPAEHSGEGIFFVSKACDFFMILSGDLVYSHSINMPVDFLQRAESEVPGRSGTTVLMVVKNHTRRTMKSVYDKYSSPDEGFYRTLVPVKLLRYKDEGIVSRSQAKRLLARFENFRSIVLDFEGISEIGQAFADEIFRVYAGRHPDVEISVTHVSKAVSDMIKRVKANTVPA